MCPGHLLFAHLPCANSGVLLWTKQVWLLPWWTFRSGEGITLQSNQQGTLITNLVRVRNKRTRCGWQPLSGVLEPAVGGRGRVAGVLEPAAGPGWGRRRVAGVLDPSLDAGRAAKGAGSIVENVHEELRDTEIESWRLRRREWGEDGWKEHSSWRNTLCTCSVAAQNLTYCSQVSENRRGWWGYAVRARLAQASLQEPAGPTVPVAPQSQATAREGQAVGRCLPAHWRGFGCAAPGRAVPSGFSWAHDRKQPLCLVLFLGLKPTVSIFKWGRAVQVRNLEQGVCEILSQSQDKQPQKKSTRGQL